MVVAWLLLELSSKVISRFASEIPHLPKHLICQTSEDTINSPKAYQLMYNCTRTSDKPPDS